MKTEQNQTAISPNENHVDEAYWASHMPTLLHALSNKLLPIVAFADLGSRRCDDPELRKYFDKIRQAAGDSRDIIIQLRQQSQHKQKDLPERYSSSPGGTQIP